MIPTMRKAKRFALIAVLAAAVLALPSDAQARGNYGHQSASATGFSSAQALSGGVTSSTINMGGGGTTSDYFTRTTLLMTVVWGTSVLLDVTVEVSWDGTNFFTDSRCTSAPTHDCSIRKWQFDPTDGTTFDLSWEPNAPYVRFTFTDPGAGSGTIVVSVIKGK
jgi:hypothetical protein